MEENKKIMLVDLDERRAKLVGRLRTLGVREDNLKLEGIARLSDDEVKHLEDKCTDLEIKGGTFTENGPNRKQRRARAAKNRRTHR